MDVISVDILWYTIVLYYSIVHCPILSSFHDIISYYFMLYVCFELLISSIFNYLYCIIRFNLWLFYIVMFLLLYILSSYLTFAGDIYIDIMILSFLIMSHLVLSYLLLSYEIQFFSLLRSIYCLFDFMDDYIMWYSRLW